MRHEQPETDESEDNLCPGTRCNRPFHAAEARRERTGEDHAVEPVLGQPIWCEGCRDLIGKLLLGLPQLAVELGSGKLMTPPAELGRKSKGDVSPSPSPAHDLRSTYDSWAKAWAQDVAKRLSVTVDLRRSGSSIPFLSGRLSYVLSQRDTSIPFGEEVQTWHRRLQIATGDRDRVLVFKIPGQCPHCSRRGGLSRRNGADLVRCTCGAVWDWDTWRLLVKAVLQEQTA